MLVIEKQRKDILKQFRRSHFENTCLILPQEVLCHGLRYYWFLFPQ
jgi:hypothetical protein